MRLAHKVALVTGGGTGIGRAICLGLAEAGASVAVNYLWGEHELQAEEVVAAIRAQGGTALAVGGDVSRSADVAAMVDQVCTELGRLDILVNSAGVQTRAPLPELSEQAWDRVLAVNLKGIFLCSQAAARVMMAQGSGRIINITSICGEIVDGPGYAHYHASKGGANMLTKALAVELAPHGINVNAVAPGNVPGTEIGDPPGAEALQEALRRTPGGRLGRPQDIVGAVLFLASDEADWVYGQVLTVDGGFTLL